jgi:tRNA pseudouridine55 synthase
VDMARRQLGMRRIGHGGTLDPMAEGLLLILAGQATRLFDALQIFPKTYAARLRFGERTDTHDRTGQVVARAPENALPLERAAVERALCAFRGRILQTPPLYSAIKKHGQPLHRLARQGKQVQRDPRPVEVYALALQSFDGREAHLDMTVSKGFYVRTLVDDLGQALGTGAVMRALTRTAIGPFAASEAISPEAIARPAGS